jgi:hypothetical protein
MRKRQRVPAGGALAPGTVTPAAVPQPTEHVQPTVPPSDFGPVLRANHDAPIVIDSYGPSLGSYPLRNIPHPQDNDAVLGCGAAFDQSAGRRLRWTFTSFLVMPPAPVRLKTLPSRAYGVSEKKQTLRPS